MINIGGKSTEVGNEGWGVCVHVCACSGRLHQVMFQLSLVGGVTWVTSLVGRGHRKAGVMGMREQGTGVWLSLERSAGARSTGPWVQDVVAAGSQ